MKSRMAITMMLVLGLLLSTTGAGLATSGLAGTGNDAATAQYPTEQPPPTPPTTTATPSAAPPATPPVQQPPQVLQPEAASQPATTPAPESPRVLDEQAQQPARAAAPAAEEPEVRPAAEAQPAQAQPAQAPRQVVAAQAGDELPFTGFAAIPVLLAGLVLLATGATLRRRTRGQG